MCAISRRAAPDKAAAGPSGDGKIRAAMNGRVVAVLVQTGRSRYAGEPVLTLEAMKMEHVHTASAAGTVAAIHVAEGEQVTTGKIVVGDRGGGVSHDTALSSRQAARWRDAICHPTNCVLCEGWSYSALSTTDDRGYGSRVARARRNLEAYSGRPVPSFSQHAT